MAGLWLLLAALTAWAADPIAGRATDDVACAASPAQRYCLYIPSGYSAAKAWPVIFAFDPRARGRVPVERFQAAAEQYGYLVAGSNNSRNGSWADSIAAAQAMADDVAGRFHVDPRRVYAAGMSGGARVALAVALSSNRIAGVIASSAGYPDAKPRKTLPFVLFGTAGTEDFNYLEMRRLDRALTSPHRLAIFDGGHVWLSPELAQEAVEWLEVQAAKSGLAARDAGHLERIYAKRVAAADTAKSEDAACLALEGIASDFQGLRDVTAIAARAASLRREKRVREAFKKERVEEEQEQRRLEEIAEWESRLATREQHGAALVELRHQLKRLSEAASAAGDSPERRVARRVLRGALAGAMERTADPDYRKIIEEFRPPRPSSP